MCVTNSNKILIITLCKSLNFGAYLQAFALQEVLKGYGYKISFLDVYDRENDIKRYKHLFGGVKSSPSGIVFNINKLISFRLAEKKLNIISNIEPSDFKAAFIGSDEVWSVTNGSFDSVPEFFGLQLPSFPKFSYAASVGSSTVIDFNRYPEYIKGISELNKISVRDQESLNVAVSASPSQDIFTVLDPTFLHNFTSNEKIYLIKSAYILIYTYGFDENIIQEIKSYAKSQNLLIISAGFFHSWVDRNINCSPFEFLSLIKNAESVITDTFHGTIFAIKYRKNFISYGGHKPKVRDLLESLNLDSSIAEYGYLTEKKEIRTNYTGLENNLNPKIHTSRQFIESCLAVIE